MDKRDRGASVGISSIIVMFVVVAMAIFAALSISTATQERKLADKFAASVEEYWELDSRCAALANEFGALWERGGDGAEYEALAEANGAEIAADGGDVLVSYTFAADSGSRIDVTLRLGEEFTVERWQLASDDSGWQPDTSLPVWQG